MRTIGASEAKTHLATLRDAGQITPGAWTLASGVKTANVLIPHRVNRSSFTMAFRDTAASRLSEAGYTS